VCSDLLAEKTSPAAHTQNFQRMGLCRRATGLHIKFWDIRSASEASLGRMLKFGNLIGIHSYYRYSYEFVRYAVATARLLYVTEQQHLTGTKS